MPILTHAGVNLRYDRTGGGPAVLLVHGWTCNRTFWERQVQALRARHTVVTVDLRGHGESDRPPGPYSIEKLAADVAGVILQLGLGASHVCGISLGGMVGFQLAVDRPSLVRSLVVINSGPKFPGRSIKGRLALFSRRMIIRTRGMKGMGKVVAKKLYPRKEQVYLREQFVERFARNDKRSYLATLRAIKYFDLMDRIGAIRCPVLVVSGDRDYTPVRAKAAYLPKLANARLAVVQDSGHATPMDQPDRLNALLDEFWRSW
jgi:pimeloyl-ACP methyl ester carboxylesterase